MCLSKLHVPISKMIKIGPKAVDVKLWLEYSSERCKRPWEEQEENVLKIKDSRD